MRRARLPGAPLLIVSLLIVPLLLVGCSTSGGEGGPPPASERGSGNLPECGSPGDAQLTLMAQAVPTANLIPCVKAIPTGWWFNKLEVRSGQAKFSLGSDRDGDRAVTVLLRRGCDLVGSTETASEQPGTTRHERVNRVSGGYGGKRFYRFAGGCVTYQFDLHGATRAEPLTAVSQALGFIDRDALRRQVEEESDGRLRLDPVQDETR